MSTRLDEVLSSLHVLELPMRTRFRGITTREVALFRGSHGWGEFSPFLEYGDEEASLWLKSGVEAAFSPAPELKRTSIAINGTVPASNDEKEIDEILSWYPGAKVFKVKVGGSINEDLVRIARVRSLRPDAKIRIDVNGSWSVNDAVFNIRTIYGEVTGNVLEYVEQPVATLDELKELKERLVVDVKIAGDELFRKAKDPYKLNLDGAVDVMMLKVAPLGGITESLKLASHHGLPIVVSSALESAVGIAHGLQLAGALPSLEYACGLATGALFTGDVAQLPIESGEMRVTTPEVDSEALTRFAAPKERLQWWRERITRAWKVGGLE